MNPQAKTYLIGGIGIVIIAGLFWWGSNQRQAEDGQETIKIGGDYAMSGSLTEYGTWTTNALTIAVDEINNNGGVNGRRIELFLEDSKGKPAEAVTAYRKLRDIEGVNYVITFQSGIALAVAPLANQDQVVQMDVSATTAAYSSPDDFTFRTSIIATDLANAAAKVMSEKFTTDKTAVMIINNDFGRGMWDRFKQSYKGNIVAEEFFEEEAADFRTQLSKIKSSGAEVVFLVSHLQQAGLIVRQAQEMGLSVQFVSDVHSVEGAEFLERGGSAAEGVLYVAPAFDPTKSNRATSFSQIYRQQHGEEPNYYAAQSYDGLMALATALANCDPSDTSCVKNELYQVDFEGVSGRIKFDRNGDVEKEAELKTIKEGQFVRYEPTN